MTYATAETKWFDLLFTDGVEVEQVKTTYKGEHFEGIKHNGKIVATLRVGRDGPEYKYHN